jgi:hypothetical protein
MPKPKVENSAQVSSCGLKFAQELFGLTVPRCKLLPKKFYTIGHREEDSWIQNQFQLLEEAFWDLS